MFFIIFSFFFYFFFFNDTATTEIYTLSLHDALPIFLDEQDAQPVHRSSGFVPSRGDRTGAGVKRPPRRVASATWGLPPGDRPIRVPSLDVERVEQRLVLLRYDLPLQLERRGELARLLREVLRHDREALDRRVARLARVERVDRLLHAGD